MLDAFTTLFLRKTLDFNLREFSLTFVNRFTGTITKQFVKISNKISMTKNKKDRNVIIRIIIRTI